MPLLDACLAFAVTMLSLATLATLATEMLVRLLGTRANGLRMMLDDLYQQELLPVVKSAGESELKKFKAYSELLMKSPLADLPANNLRNRIVKFTAKWLGLTNLTKLDFDDFLKRLPETELGKKVATLAEQERRKLFERLAQRYDEFGKAVNDLFARYSQLFSLLAGIGIAFAMNVDSFRLFEAFQKDAALRGRVVASSDQVIATWERTQAQVDERQNGSGEGETALTKQQLDEKGEEFVKLWQNANSADLPIGYAHFQRMPVSQQPISANRRTVAWVQFYGGWFVRVLISGLLIGLGGPFWYNVATKLMSVTRSFRNGEGGSTQSSAADTKSKKATGTPAAARSIAAGGSPAESNPADDLFMKFVRTNSD